MPNAFKTQAGEKIAAAKAIAEKAESESRDFTADERGQVKTLTDEARDLMAKGKEADGDAELKTGIGELAKELFANAGITPAGKGGSFGDRAAAGLADYLKALNPSGGHLGKNTRVQSPAIQFAGLKDLYGRKDILTGSESDRGGALLTPDFRGLLDAGVHERPLTIRDLVTAGRTTTDTVSYARVASVTNAAAPVPEATGTSGGDASGDVAGTKPESDIVLEQVEDTVKTIAHWIPMTRRALSDAAQVATLAESFLRYGLEEELEDQMLSGAGTGENFEGIFEVDGTQSQAFDTDIFVTARKAITKAKKNGRARNITIVVSLEDEENIDLLRDGNDRFFGNGPFNLGPATLWGRRIVASEALDEGTAIIGDFSWATLWDREDAGVMLSDSHADFFVRNLVAMLAELRAGFGVIRPSAFVITDLAA